MDLLLRHAWREVRRQRWIMLGLALLTAVIVIGLGARARTRATLVQTRERVADRLGVADVEVRFHGLPRARALAAAVRAGARAAEARLVVVGRLELPDGRAMAASVQVLPEGAVPRLNRYEVVSGRAPGSAERAVLIDRSLAADRGLRPGDVVTLTLNEQRQRLPVVGVALFADHLVTPTHPGHALPVRGSLAVVAVTAGTFEDVERGDRVTSLLLDLPAGVDSAAIAQVFADGDALVEQLTPRQERPDWILIDVILEAYDVYGPAALVMLTASGLLLLVLTHLHLARRRRVELGLLKAQGLGTVDLLVQPIVLACLPVFLGTALAAGLNGRYSARIAAALMEPSGLPPPLDPGVQPMLWATAAGCLLVGVVAAIAGTLWAARRPPASLLRGACADGAVGGAAMRAAAGLARVFRAPPPLLLGLTQAARSRGTTLVTVLGLGAGFSVAFASLIVHASHREEVLDTLERWSRDATVQLGAPAPVERLEALGARVAGAAEPFVSTPAFVVGPRNKAYRIVLGLSAHGLAARLPLAVGSALPDDHAPVALVDGWLARHDGIALGDVLSIHPSTHAPEGVSVRVVGLLGGVSFGRIVLPLGVAQSLLHARGHATGAFLTSDLPAAEMERLLVSIPDLAAVLPTAVAEHEVRSSFAAREVVMQLAVLASLVLALVFLGMTAATDVLERAPQLATLRALGWSDGALATALITEVLVRGGLGLLAAWFAAPVLADAVIARMTLGHASTMHLPVGAIPHVVPLLIFLALPLAALPAWLVARRFDPTLLLRTAL